MLVSELTELDSYRTHCCILVHYGFEIWVHMSAFSLLHSTPLPEYTAIHMSIVSILLLPLLFPFLLFFFLVSLFLPFLLPVLPSCLSVSHC